MSDDILYGAILKWMRSGMCLPGRTSPAHLRSFAPVLLAAVTVLTFVPQTQGWPSGAVTNDCLDYSLGTRVTSSDPMVNTSFRPDDAIGAKLGTAEPGNAIFFDNGASVQNMTVTLPSATKLAHLNFFLGVEDPPSYNRGTRRVQVWYNAGAGDVLMLDQSGAQPWKSLSADVTQAVAAATFKFAFTKYNTTGSRIAEIDGFPEQLIDGLTVLGTNGAAMTSGEAASVAKGMDFGALNIAASVTNIFTITNSGSADLTGLAITKNGAHANDFAVGALGATALVPGTSTTFTVTFTPTDAGARSAAILISTNANAENHFDLILAGTGLGPEIAVQQPAGTDLVDGAAGIGFGGIFVGASSAATTFTITNSGNADLSGLAITKDGPHANDFAVSAPGATTLAPGTSTTFTVTFTPGVVGARSAAIHIANNDSNENPFDINLTGSGTLGDTNTALLAFYPFSGNANDVTGSNNGTVHNATLTADRFGNPNSAYELNGSSSYISMAHNFDFLSMTGVTYSAWIKPASNANSGFIFFQGQGGEMCLQASSNGVYFYVHLSNESYYTASASIPTGGFVHVAGVFRKGQQVELWVNGALASKTVGLPNLALFSPWWSDYFYASIGVYHHDWSGSGNPPFHDWYRGTIDDFRIYSRALPQADIQALAFIPAPEMQAPELGPGGTVVIRWTSYANHLYTIHHSTNLLNGFSELQSHIQATPSLNTYTDNVNGVSMKFWKVSTDQ